MTSPSGVTAQRTWGLGTRHWWHHLQIFAGVEINTGSLLSNSPVEEIFIPGDSHEVTLPRGVMVCVGVFMAAVKHLQSLGKESFWDASS